MSTNDVPGANSANKDELACGCWAETSDGSLLFVYTTENDEVVYSMFDISKTPVQEFRDKMPADEFKKYFSYNGNNAKWTWHDKTPFPWDRVISKGARDGVLPSASAHDQLSETKNIVQSLAKILGLSGNDLDEKAISHMVDNDKPKRIIDVMQEAINECPVGSNKKLERLYKKKMKIDAKIAALTE